MSNKPRLWTGDFILLLLISFLGFSTCQAINNGLPLFIANMGGTTAFSGVLLMVFAASAAVTRIFIGRIVDKRGRHATMLIGGIIMLAGTVLAIPLSDSMFQIAARSLQGIGFSCLTTASGTAGADVVPQERLGEGVGYFSLGQSLGMAVGPSLGVLLATLSWHESLFVGTAAIAAACLICISCSSYEKHPERLPETSAYRWRCEHPDPPEEAPDAPREPLLSSVFVKTALAGAAPMLVVSLANAIPTSYTALFAVQRGIANPGLFFVFGAIAMTAVRLGAARLFDTVRPRILYLAAIACGVVEFALMVFAQSEAMLYTAGVFFGLSMGMIVPVLMSVAVKATEQSHWGAANSLVFLATDVGIGIGAVVWGVVADAWGFVPVMIGGAVLMVLSYLVAVFAFPRK